MQNACKMLMQKQGKNAKEMRSQCKTNANAKIGQKWKNGCINGKHVLCRVRRLFAKKQHGVFFFFFFFKKKNVWDWKYDCERDNLWDEVVVWLTIQLKKFLRFRTFLNFFEIMFTVLPCNWNPRYPEVGQKKLFMNNSYIWFLSLISQWHPWKIL